MSEAITQFFSERFPPEIAVFLTSMIPVVECRGAIPFGAILDLPALKVFLLAVIGNLLPVPFILWLMRPLMNWFKKTKLFRPFAEWLDRKAAKNKEKVLKYEFWGLCLFVAIPLPGTGAWTGSLVASVFDLRIKKALPSIIIGVLISSSIMTLISYGISALTTLF